MVPLAGYDPPAWCERYECPYYGRSCPECETETEDYYADIGDANVWDLE